MKKKTRKAIRIIIGLATTLFLGSIAWTNESIDYLNKIGIQGINPSWTFLITAFLFVISLTWVMWEIFDRR